MPEQLRMRGVLRRLPGKTMSNRDDDPPAKVVPVGQAVPQAIGNELRKYYKTLVEQELPDKISALFKHFDELTKETSGPETGVSQAPPAAKKPQSE
jgi:hypothetical protein